MPWSEGRIQTGHLSDYWHCWWECCQIQIFWKTVVYHISKITSHDIPVTPEVILLDLWPDSRIPVSSRNLISLLLLAAKCVVARKWKQTRSPTIKDWYTKIWDLMIADKLSEGILIREQKPLKVSFLEKWFPFLDYLHSAKFVRNWMPRKYCFISLRWTLFVYYHGNKIVQILLLYLFRTVDLLNDLREITFGLQILR